MNYDCYKCCHFQDITRYCFEMDMIIKEENTKIGECPFYVNVDSDNPEE